MIFKEKLARDDGIRIFLKRIWFQASFFRCFGQFGVVEGIIFAGFSGCGSFAQGTVS